MQRNSSGPPLPLLYNLEGVFL